MRNEGAINHALENMDYVEAKKRSERQTEHDRLPLSLRTWATVELLLLSCCHGPFLGCGTAVVLGDCCSHNAQNVGSGQKCPTLRLPTA